MGSRCRFARTALSGCELLARTAHRRIAPAHAQQSTDNVAHHVVQKGIGGHFNAQQRVAAPDLKRLDAPHRGARLTLSGSIGTEVMLTQQIRRRLTHRLGIERRVDHQCAAGSQSGAAVPVEQEISITAPQRAVPRMKSLADGLHPAQTHFSRQGTVGAEQPRAGTANGCRIEVRHLAACVHTGIGAASASERHGRVRNAAEGLLNCPLH